MGQSITVNRVPIEWHDGGAGFTFFGIEAVIFWQNPSLVTILGPLREALGESFYHALIANEAAKGTYEDYHAMVERLGEDFPSGFLEWGRAVSGAGWGVFELERIDWSAPEAVVRIDRPWELNLFGPSERACAVPFLEGKLSGIFSWTFGTQCRATVESLERTDDGWPAARLRIAPSTRSLEDDLNEVSERQGLTPEQALQISNRELSEHLERFVQVVEAAGQFVWESDRALRLGYITDRVRDALGYGPDELTGTDLRALMGADARASIDAWLAGEGPAGATGAFEVEAVARDGEPRWLSLAVTGMLDHSGTVIGYRGVGRDITAQRRADDELRLLATAFETSQAIVIVDAADRIHRVNAGFERITGLGAATVIDTRATALWPASKIGPSYTVIRDAVRDRGRWEGECSIACAGGDSVPVWLAASMSPTPGGEAAYLVLAFHDLSEQKRLERRLEWEATHDHLTGLYNRAQCERLLDYEARRAGRYGRPLGLILFDIDHFKWINDSAGHDVGDAALRELARRVVANVRNADVVGRWGGEEFVVLAPETAGESVRRLAEKLRTVVADTPFEALGGAPLTISAGVAEMSGETDPASLVHAADRALYAAKAGGRDRVAVAD